MGPEDGSKGVCPQGIRVGVGVAVSFDSLQQNTRPTTTHTLMLLLQYLFLANHPHNSTAGASSAAHHPHHNPFIPHHSNNNSNSSFPFTTSIHHQPLSGPANLSRGRLAGCVCIWKASEDSNTFYCLRSLIYMSGLVL